MVTIRIVLQIQFVCVQNNAESTKEDNLSDQITNKWV